MRREGSPFRGVGIVFGKEYADHLSSARMRIIEALMVVVAVFVVWVAVSDLKEQVSQDSFLFLRLFTYAPRGSKPLAELLMYLIPLVAIGLGFDSINGEFNRRTMSRILSQPIYRDALLIGKFLAGVATLGTGLMALWLLVMGGGLLVLGVPPSSEEVLRGVAFLLAATAYGGVWLAVALLTSVLFRSAATSALTALGLWLFFSFLWPEIAPTLFRAFAPAINSVDEAVSVIEAGTAFMRISPNILFQGIWPVLFSPDQFSELHLVQFELNPRLAQRVVPGAAASLGESLVTAWPYFTVMVASAIVLFTITYVAFQRQEVRA